MPKLKAYVTDVESVEESYRSLYEQTEDGEGYVLQLDGVDAHPEVANLRSAYQKVKDKEANLRKAVQEASPDVWRAVSDTLKGLQDGKPWKDAAEPLKNVEGGALSQQDQQLLEQAKKHGIKKEGDDSQVVQLRQQLERERDTEKSRADAAEEQLRQYKVDSELGQALDQAGVTNPSLRKAATALLRPQAQLGDNGDVQVESDMGPMALGDHVKRWVQSDEGAAFVTPAKGGDAAGSEGGSGAVNLEQFQKMGDDERMKLYEEKPELFNKLTEQARKGA